MDLDWKDEFAYAFVAALPRTHLAWEFLRRSQKYHADWSAFLSKVAPLEAVNGPWITWFDSPDSVQDIAAWTLWPAARPGESIHQWRDRTASTPGRLQQLLPESRGRTWMLRRMTDPSADPSEVQFLGAPEPLLRWDAQELARESEHVETLFETWGFARFDLSDDIDRQLSALRERLRTKQEALVKAGVVVRPLDPPKQYEKLLPRYLRLLDASNAGIDVAQMVPFVLKGENDAPPDFPARKKLHKNLLRARYLADMGYRWWLPAKHEAEAGYY